MKGPAQWHREPHKPPSKYAAFLVKGKGEAAREERVEYVHVEETVLGGEGVMPSLKSLGY